MITTAEAVASPRATSVDAGHPKAAVGSRLDQIERWIAILCIGQLIVRLLVSYAVSRSPSALIVLPAELIALYFLLVRRKTDSISPAWHDWGIALIATVLPTLIMVNEHATRWMPYTVAGSLALSGLMIQFAAKLSLGKSLGMVAANRGIKGHGAYRYVRHPMYLGYFLGHLAMLGLYLSAWNVAVLGLAAGFQLVRIAREEKWLSVDPLYCEYKKRVPFRLLPFLY
jgi:protein-S-isoprenylcysteine O-methyltransferase Ste14